MWIAPNAQHLAHTEWNAQWWSRKEAEIELGYLKEKKKQAILHPILRTNKSNALRYVFFFFLSDTLFTFRFFCAIMVLLLRQRDAKFCNICAKMLFYLIAFAIILF